MRVRHGEIAAEERSDAAAPERPFVVVAPSITSRPATGPTFGAAATLAVIDGDPETTHLSTAAANLKLSVKGQTMSSIRFNMFSSADRWFVQGENRFWWTSLDTHALGVAGTADAENLKYDWFRLYDTAYRRIGDSRWFVGTGVNVNDHTGIRPNAGAQAAFTESAYARYSEARGFELDRQVSGGTNAALLFDTRDNAINAQRGWLGSATYRTFFSGFLGGASTWQELDLDVRTYRALTRDARHKIAVWFLGDLVTGGTPPFLDLPSTSGDQYGRSARGYAEGRFRGPRLLYGEAEYRGTLTPNGFLGVVAFLNVTTVDGDQPTERLFRSFAPAAGTGVRLLLDKHTRTNLCADYAMGTNGSRGLYIAIQEAF